MEAPDNNTVIGDLTLPDILPQTFPEAVAFIESLKLKEFAIDRVKDLPREYTGLDDIFVELHEDMLVDLRDEDREKMQPDTFVYKSKREAYFPLNDYTSKAYCMGVDIGGDAFIYLRDLKGIYGAKPVARVSHDASEAYVTIYANSIPEYYCRLALEQWGDEHKQDEAISKYLYRLDHGFSEK